jgi:hypothetical protein
LIGRRKLNPRLPKMITTASFVIEGIRFLPCRGSTWVNVFCIWELTQKLCFLLFVLPIWSYPTN